MDAIGCRCVCFSAGLHQEVKDNVMRARDFGMMKSERARVNELAGISVGDFVNDELNTISRCTEYLCSSRMISHWLCLQLDSAITSYEDIHQNTRQNTRYIKTAFLL
jgi:hypothetical protein